MKTPVKIPIIDQHLELLTNCKFCQSIVRVLLEVRHTTKLWELLRPPCRKVAILCKMIMAVAVTRTVRSVLRTHIKVSVLRSELLMVTSHNAKKKLLRSTVAEFSSKMTWLTNETWLTGQDVLCSKKAKVNFRL